MSGCDLMRPSIVYKSESVQITCPPAYLEPSPKLAHIGADENYKAYSMGIVIDYLILSNKHKGLVDCIDEFNSAHK